MAYDSIDGVITALEEFKPVDYEPENLCRLYEIFENFGTLETRERAVPTMFALLERYPTAELGSPGPVVHELEDIAGYESSLKASLSRLPTATTLFMVNRIMNSTTDGEVWSAWMTELQNALVHPLGDEGMRQNARFFIEHQTKRGIA